MSEAVPVAQRPEPVLPIRVRVGIVVRRFLERYWPEVVVTVVAVIAGAVVGWHVGNQLFPLAEYECTVESISRWTSWSECQPCGAGVGSRYRTRNVKIENEKTTNRDCVSRKQQVKCNAGPCCSDGFETASFLATCFKAEPYEASWEKARQLAGEVGADLASVTFEKQHDWLADLAIHMFEEHRKDGFLEKNLIWLGLRCYATYGSCRWTNDKPMTMSRLHTYYIKTKKDTSSSEPKCAALNIEHRDHPSWQLINCDEDLPFFLERNSSALETCKTTNVTYCYKMVQDAQKWETVQENLVTINSEMEQHYLTELIKKQPDKVKKSCWWIGLKCKETVESCRWRDGSGLTFKNELTTQPGCVCLKSDSSWNVRDCAAKLPHILEQKPRCNKLLGEWSHWSVCVPVYGRCGPGKRARQQIPMWEGENCMKRTGGPEPPLEDGCNVMCDNGCDNFKRTSKLDHCYELFVTQNLTFNEIDNYPLLTINSELEQFYVGFLLDSRLEAMKKLPERFYIGMVCSAVLEGDWRSCRWKHSKLTLAFNNFAPMHPKPGKHCVYITSDHKDSHFWYSVKCDESLYHITEAAPESCSKFVFFQAPIEYELPVCNKTTLLQSERVHDFKNCPNVNQERVTLCSGKDVCQQLSNQSFDYCYEAGLEPMELPMVGIKGTQGHGELMVIDKRATQKLIVTHVLPKDKHKQCPLAQGAFFIGLSCFSPKVGDWKKCRWLGGEKKLLRETLHHNFLSGQPDTNKGRCVAINGTDTNGTWYSISCLQKACYVLEYGVQCNKTETRFTNPAYSCVEIGDNNETLNMGGRCWQQKCLIRLLERSSHQLCEHPPEPKFKTEFISSCCTAPGSVVPATKVDAEEGWIWCLGAFLLKDAKKQPEGMYNSFESVSCDDYDAVRPPLAPIDTLLELDYFRTTWSEQLGKDNLWTAGICEGNGDCYWKWHPCSPSWSFPGKEFGFWKGGAMPQTDKGKQCVAMDKNGELILLDCAKRQHRSFAPPRAFDKIDKLVRQGWAQTRVFESMELPTFHVERHNCDYMRFNGTYKYKWEDLRLNFSYCYLLDEATNWKDATIGPEFTDGPVMLRLLVSIRTQEEQDHIYSLIKASSHSSQQHLIGLQCRAMSDSVRCVWQDGTQMQYENFWPGNPNIANVTNQKWQCVVIDPVFHGFWRSVDCNGAEVKAAIRERLPYCDKFDPWSAVNVPGDGFQGAWTVQGKMNISGLNVPDSGCPFVSEKQKPKYSECPDATEDWKYCYLPVANSRPVMFDWFRKFGRDLVRIESSKEQEQMLKLRLIDKKEKYLIGLHCATQKINSCKWMDGGKLKSSLSTLFQKGHPLPNKHCVKLDAEKQKWFSHNCSEPVTAYILERAPICDQKQTVEVEERNCSGEGTTESDCCGWMVPRPIGCIGEKEEPAKQLTPGNECCKGITKGDVDVCVAASAESSDWTWWLGYKDAYIGRLLVLNDTKMQNLVVPLFKQEKEKAFFTAGVCYKGDKCYWPGAKPIDKSLFGLDKIIGEISEDGQPLMVKLDGKQLQFELRKTATTKAKALIGYRKYDITKPPPFYGF